MKLKRLSYIVLGIVFLFGLFAIGLTLHVDQRMQSPLKLEQPELLVVNPGEYAHFIINRLFERQIITSSVDIKIGLKLEPSLSLIRSGTYELTPGMSIRDLFNKLSSGEEKQFSIQLIEGLTWKNWKQQLNTHTQLAQGPEGDKEWFEVLGGHPKGDAIEGWLLPETYYFTANQNAADVVRRAYADMQAYLEDAWQNRALDLPYDDPYEALIMASIIEKETGLASERPRISGVFVNRLRLGMRLQTDPTVIYGMGDSFDGNIRKKDLRTPTAYNTYVIKGLPPTPIAMPSKLAIDAAMHPLETQELYFVSKGDGSHQFSETLAEHNKAVRKFQLKK